MDSFLSGVLDTTQKVQATVEKLKTENDIGVAVSTQEDLKKCVAPPFIKGVKQLESFVEVLQNEAIGADITQAKVEQVASKLRPHITEAYNEFSAANGEAEALNKEVTHKADAAVAELSKIEEQSNKIKADVDKLAIEVKTVEGDVTTTEKTVQGAMSNYRTAQSSFYSAMHTLEEKEKERRKADLIGDLTGIGGLVVAKILDLTVFEQAAESAKRKIGAAKDYAVSERMRLEKSKATLETDQIDLERKRQEQAAKQGELAQTKQVCKEIRMTQDRLLDMSTEFRRVVTFVGVTLGRSEVIKGELEEPDTLETIYEPLYEIAESFQSAELMNSKLLSGKLDLVAAGKKLNIIRDKMSAKLLFS